MLTRLTWIVAVVAGLVVGGFAFHFPGSYGSSVLSPQAALVGLIMGGINGLLVGGLAWIALRLSRRDGLRVLVAMTLIIGGTHALNDGSSSQFPFLVVESLVGLIAASVVASILDERRPAVLAVVGTAWTIGIALAAWSGSALGLPLTETPLGWAQDHAWDGLITGLVWGVATAAIDLPGDLRRDVPGPSSSALATD